MQKKMRKENLIFGIIAQQNAPAINTNDADEQDNAPEAQVEAESCYNPT